MSSRELKFAPDGAMLREVRSKVREVASSLGASESVCDSLALVVDELVELAHQLDSVNLPSDRDFLAARVEASLQSFAGRARRAARRAECPN